MIQLTDKLVVGDTMIFYTGGVRPSQIGWHRKVVVGDLWSQKNREATTNVYTQFQGQNTMRISISKLHISSLNSMFDHLLEPSH